MNQFPFGMEDKFVSLYYVTLALELVYYSRLTFRLGRGDPFPVCYSIYRKQGRITVRIQFLKCVPDIDDFGNTWAWRQGFMYKSICYFDVMFCVQCVV